MRGTRRPKQAFTPGGYCLYVHRISGLPVIVKGIQSPEDAEIAIEPGPQEYGVFNHGGHPVDSGPSSFDMLPAIAKSSTTSAVLYDSGYAVVRTYSKR